MAMVDMYDVQGAASGQASQLQPEERQMQRIQRMIMAAESTNYDGDPEYYNQIKSLAMQAGIPIKTFKTNPFRLAKAAGLSFLDSATAGLVPNSLYEPMNPGEEAAVAAGGVAGFFTPGGVPMAGLKIARGGLSALKSGSIIQKALKGGMGAKNYKAASKWKGIDFTKAKEKVASFGRKKKAAPKKTAAPKKKRSSAEIKKEAKSKATPKKSTPKKSTPKKTAAPKKSPGVDPKKVKAADKLMDIRKKLWAAWKKSAPGSRVGSPMHKTIMKMSKSDALKELAKLTR
jgi:hypothetical protein